MDQSSKPKRCAVVLVHGIGNQSPMESLRGFVNAVWWLDPQVKRLGNPQLWVKPLEQNEDYETRRITSSAGTSGRRTDFYEFYWAHQTEGTRLSSVFWWLNRLYRRRPNRIPETVALPHSAIGIAMLGGVLGLALVAMLLLGSVMALDGGGWQNMAFALLLLCAAALVIGLFWWLGSRVLVKVVGDASRYLTPDPENIAARSRIRASGIKLLRQLQSDERYDRIVLVGHSLGTVVALDMLSILWAEQVKELNKDNAEAKTAIEVVERTAEDLKASFLRMEKQEDSKSQNERDDRREAFRKAQCAYSATLAVAGIYAWKITDFVTLGSPLTHSSFLLVNDKEELQEADKDRMRGHSYMLWLDHSLKGMSNMRRTADVFAARVVDRTIPVSPPVPEQVASLICDMFLMSLVHGRNCRIMLLSSQRSAGLTFMPDHDGCFGGILSQVRLAACLVPA